ncbi:MAG: hypothetical protein V7756_13745 [Halopseudomonas sp.]|uniref:hypothetical protein n=1 Tax=Halopseudomonas sp. TaxID=2901191 RepID=UPI0030033062
MTAITLRQACPPGTCDCDREQLLDDPSTDARILRLTLHEERRLMERLEQVTTLQQLEHLQQRMQEQLGIRLQIGPGVEEIRVVRGIGMAFSPQPGLCRKTRKAIPAAIRRCIKQHPEIAYELLNRHDLLRDA